METKEKMRQEINLVELFWKILLGWRQSICFAVIFSIVLAGAKYISDVKEYTETQNKNSEEILLTVEEKQQVEDAKTLLSRIENYQNYLNESELMKINPYEKPIVELQYYVESDYVYNYTKDNLADYTNDLMSLYYNYVKSGEMSNEIIRGANLSISQADFSELCSVVQNGKTMVITVTWAEKDKLKNISECIKAQLSEKELDFQEVGSHKLKLLRESQNIVADTDLAEKKNTFANNIAYINTQLVTLKASMSEQQLQLLRVESGFENNAKKVEIGNPVVDYRFVILGAILGIMVASSYLAWRQIFTGKLQNADEVCNGKNIRLLGEITIEKKKRWLSFIDNKILEMKNRKKRKVSMEQQSKIISANIGLLCEKQNIEGILISGSQYEKLDLQNISKIKKELRDQDILIEEGGNILYDVDSLKKGCRMEYLILVEEIGRAVYSEILEEINKAKEQNIKIMGIIVLQ